jgi:predicted RNA-binding protein
MVGKTGALIAAGLFASSSLLPTRSVLAQPAPVAHPEMSNVIPDGGTGGIEGKVHSIDMHTRMLEIAPKDGHLTAFYAGPNVRIDNIEVGDDVDALFTRDVLWVVTPAGQESLPGQSTKVGDVAHAPGGAGPAAQQINGRVTKIDSAGHRFDIVDATGGGQYTVVVTDPSRQVMMQALNVGSGISVLMSPLTITSMEKCGWFGCL